MVINVAVAVTVSSTVAFANAVSIGPNAAVVIDGGFAVAVVGIFAVFFAVAIAIGPVVADVVPVAVYVAVAGARVG